MAEGATTQVWIRRGVFLGLAVLVIIIQLLPLNIQPARWAGPDVLLAITLVWVARRPEYLPVLVIAGVFLLADLLFQRAPGLWAALVVLLSEAIRKRSRDFRSMPVIAEWSTVAIGIVGITLLNRLVLGIVMTPQPPLGMVLIQMLSTIIIYPPVAIFAHWIFGIRRRTPGELGHKRQHL